MFFAYFVFIVSVLPLISHAFPCFIEERNHDLTCFSMRKSAFLNLSLFMHFVLSHISVFVLCHYEILWVLCFLVSAEVMLGAKQDWAECMTLRYACYVPTVVHLLNFRSNNGCSTLVLLTCSNNSNSSECFVLFLVFHVCLILIDTLRGAAIVQNQWYFRSAACQPWMNARYFLSKFGSCGKFWNN